MRPWHLVLFGCFVARSAAAQVPTKLDGAWKQSALRDEYVVETWQKECGPTPASSTTGGGETVQITEEGDELHMVGGGRDYRTSSCYEPQPTLSRDTHSKDLAKHVWRTRCSTPAGDPRRSTIDTSVTANSDLTRIDLVETGRYEMVLTQGKCSAVLTRRRSFDRTLPKVVEPVPVKEPPPKEVPEVKEPRCSTPGDPARLEVRPARRAAKVGESFQLRAAVLDAKGCGVSAPVAWKLADGSDGVKIFVDGTGRVQVAPDSREGTAHLRAEAIGKEVLVTVTVSSAEDFDALLKREGFDLSGETQEVASSGGVVIGAETSSAAGDGIKQRNRFLALVGSLVVILGVLAVLTRKKNTKAPASVREPDIGPVSRPIAPATVANPPKPAANPAPIAPVAAQTSATQAAAASVPLICPSCLTKGDGRAQFCPKDGSRLVREADLEASRQLPRICPVCSRAFEPGVKTCPTHGEELVPRGTVAAQTPAGKDVQKAKGKICPSCGRQFTGNVAFCGHDGTTLVLIN